LKGREILLCIKYEPRTPIKITFRKNLNHPVYAISSSRLSYWNLTLNKTRDAAALNQKIVKRTSKSLNANYV